MICTPCKRDQHYECPESTRQSRIRNAPGRDYQEDRLRVLAVTSGQVCDCRHKPRLAPGPGHAEVPVEVADVEVPVEAA